MQNIRCFRHQISLMFIPFDLSYLDVPYRLLRIKLYPAPSFCFSLTHLPLREPNYLLFKIFQILSNPLFLFPMLLNHLLLAFQLNQFSDLFFCLFNMSYFLIFTFNIFNIFMSLCHLHHFLIMIGPLNSTQLSFQFLNIHLTADFLTP